MEPGLARAGTVISSEQMEEERREGDWQFPLTIGK